MKRELDYKLY